MWGPEVIVDGDVIKSGITGQPIVPEELVKLFDVVPGDAARDEYERAVMDDNVLGLTTDSGRKYRLSVLRRLYSFRKEDVLFRALRDLWDADKEGQPLLAALCALAKDTIFRASAKLIIETNPGEKMTRADFELVVDARFPGVYAKSTLVNIGKNAYASWEHAGHLGPADRGSKVRRVAECQPSDVAYAFMIGYIEGARGDALFDTLWAQVLDHPKSYLHELAFSASQRGMLEYKNAGGVVEVGFRDLLRPMEGKLF